MNNDRRDFLLGLSVTSLAGLGSVSTLEAQDVVVPPIVLDPTLSEYLPIDPVDVPKVKTSTAGVEQIVFWAGLMEDARRLLLPNQNAVVRTTKIDINGGASFLTSNFAASKGKYKVTVDYCRYRDENVLNGANIIIGRGKVGVGLRVVATVDTTKTNLNLSGLIPLAINLSTASLTGSLEIKVIGIVNEKVSSLIAVPTTLDETSITKAMEAIGAIKVLVDANGTTSVPQLLAISRANAANPAPVIQSIQSPA